MVKRPLRKEVRVWWYFALSKILVALAESDRLMKEKNKIEIEWRNHLLFSVKTYAN